MEERTGEINLKKHNTKRTPKQRHGYTLAEALLSLVCISFVILAVVSSTSFIRNSAQSIRGQALIETYMVSVAETITQDLQDGVDISNVDYNNDIRLNDRDRTGVSSNIIVDWQEGVFGATLYEIRVECYAYKYDVEDTVRFFLRGGDF